MLPAAMLLLPLPVGSTAQAASIQLGVGADPAEDRAVVISASGVASDPGSVVSVTVRGAGGAPCPVSAEGSLAIQGRGTGAPGPYAVDGHYTFPQPGTYELCAYLDSPQEGDARTSLTATVRSNYASIAFDAGDSPPSDRPFVIAMSGVTEVPRAVFATITPALGAVCGESYVLDTGDDDLAVGARVEGSYSVREVLTLPAGHYLLCAWVQEARGDLAAEASTSTTVSVGTSSAGLAEAAEAARFPAKLKVLRASIRDGKLDALFSITGRATGSITVDYQAAEAFNRYRADVGAAREGEKRVRLVRPLNARQRKLPTGIINAGFAGNATTQADSLRLRAANGASRLVRDRLSFSGGRLEVGGTINRNVSGVVRLRVTYLDAHGSLGEWTGRTTVTGGAWNLAEALPPAAAADPNAYLTTQFTGDKDAAGGPYRGEQDGKSIGNL